MSLAQIRAALEGQLIAATPAIQTAFENSPFVPTTGVPFQQPFVLPATPANLEIGPGYTEQGIFQVSLYFPKDTGAAAAISQAEQVRTAFAFRSSFVSGAVTVIITGTPEIGPARPDADRTMVPVKIRWSARLPA